MSEQQRLPLWRLIGGFAILGSFVVVIALLAPFAIHNYQLTSYVRSLPDGPDDAVRAEVVERARALGLPVGPGDIEVRHEGGKLRLRTKYAVKSLWFYPVDMHLQANTR